MPPSYSPRPTDPGPPCSDSVLWAEYNRGYADGQIAAMRACTTNAPSFCPPQPIVVPPGEKRCRSLDSERLLTRLLAGLFLGLTLGLLIGLFLGLFIGSTGRV